VARKLGGETRDKIGPMTAVKPGDRDQSLNDEWRLYGAPYADRDYYPLIRFHRLTPRQVIMLRAAAVIAAAAAGHFLRLSLDGGLASHHLGAVITAGAAILAPLLWRGWWQATSILAFLTACAVMVSGLGFYYALAAGNWERAAGDAMVFISCAVYVHEFGYLCLKR
jgi:hypothetical protein